MSQGRIHIGGSGPEVWTWRAGRGSVVVRDPDRRSYVVDMSTLTGASWSDIERSHWKQCRGGCHEITPAIVRKYIEDVIKRGKHHKNRIRAHRGGPKDWRPGGVSPGRFITK